MSHFEKNIFFLIGFSGSGKSYWGEQIRTNLGYNWVDTDREIERKYQLSIHQIFQRLGEEEFRKIEKDMLCFLVYNHSTHKTIISVGGGLPCFHNNISYMKENGTVIWINMKIESLFSRLSKSKSRPLTSHLNEEELRLYILQNLEKRSAFYRQAHYQLSEPISINHFISIFNTTQINDNN